MDKKNILHKVIRKHDDYIDIGIDEAGRGPVLGYMVFGAVVSSEVIKYKDSKLLTPSQRETSFKEIQENNNLSHIYFALHPSYITTEMQNKSLNEISYIAQINIIKCLEHLKIRNVYLDIVGPISTHQKRLKTIFPNLNFIIEEKADSKYGIVGAASILAKVTRDKLLINWKFKDNNYGSGYPSDPETIKWLDRNFNPLFGYSDIVRFKWSTIERRLGIRKSKNVSSLGFYADFD
ncbi:ribonuclease HII [Hamiltosporidium magnivora]|uniref:Ribonuclease n=1 Tax=Hamiltosporidium magnivora TaxID=148818 RepID=A0A4Q9LKE2_9MICR|nr:ribonuclease HII [Hamiltosporidium magnivora]